MNIKNVLSKYLEMFLNNKRLEIEGGKFLEGNINISGAKICSSFNGKIHSFKRSN